MTDQQKKGKKTPASIFIVWILGIIFILTGIITLVTRPIAGIAILLAGTAFLPPFWKFVKEKFSLAPSLPYKATIIIGLLVVNAIFGDHSSDTNANTTADKQTSSSPSPAVSDTPTDTPEPTVTLAPTLTSQQILANFEKEGQIVTVAAIYKSPNSYKDKGLIFTCSVSGFPKNDSGDVAGLNCDDPNDYGSNVQISIDKSIDVTKINQNDTLKVYGMGLGAIQGKNGFGGDITTGGVMGLYFNDLTTGYKNY